MAEENVIINIKNIKYEKTIKNNITKIDSQIIVETFKTKDILLIKITNIIRLIKCIQPYVHNANKFIDIKIIAIKIYIKQEENIR